MEGRLAATRRWLQRGGKRPDGRNMTVSLLGTRPTAPAPLHPTERRSWVRGHGAQLAVYEYGPEPGPGVPEVLQPAMRPNHKKKTD